MDGWMEYIINWMDGWMDEVHYKLDGWMDGWMEEQNALYKDEWMDG